MLDICFVHPEYRRRGVGRLLMAWGINKADEMGLESYIDATEAGMPLYETCGYTKASRLISMHRRINRARSGKSFR